MTFEAYEKSKKMIDSLNKLLRLNIDASKGYHFAAENIENENFRNFLSSYARQRENYAEELREEISRLGGEPTNNTTMLGDVHQAMLKVRESVSPSHDAALLEECARGEDEAISQYAKVLKSVGLSRDQKQLIMTQFDKIKAAQSTMAELERVV